MRLLGIFSWLLALLGGCSDKRVPEDHWYPEAELLCQRRHCPDCGGSRGVTCPRCDGAGDLLCGDCSGSGTVTCRRCGGSGEHQGKCKGCNGRGKATCSDCGGDGRETCGTCDGKKKIACLQLLPIAEPPVTVPEDAWPPGNFQGAEKK